MTTRILWVTKGLGPGGAERLLVAAASTIDRDEFTVDCAYVLPWKDHLVGELETLGVTTRCLSRTRSDPRWPLRLMRLIRQGDYDVVHVHSPLPGAVARLAAFSMGRRRPVTMSTEHNTWPTYATPTRWVNRLTSRLDAATIAVSDEVASSVRGPRARHVAKLDHGIDTAAIAALRDERTAVRNELGIAPDAFVIGTVANFRPQKDYPNLLAAASSAAARSAQLHWVIVGQGPQEDATRQLADDLGVADRVTFTGFRPDATRVMTSFDVFTLASAWEGLPVALMEAHALGLPVVATAVGGVAESLTGSPAAQLVPPGDAEALANAWLSVESDDDRQAEMSRASLSLAERYDARRSTDVQAALWSELAARRTSPAPPAPEPRPASATSRRARTTPEIRPATQEDRPRILELLARSMNRPDDARYADLFRWKHDDNPFGASPCWVATEGDEVIAVRVFMRWEFVRGGEVLRAVRAVDTATDPDHQGKGLFRALTLHGLEQVRAEGVDLVFNTPNDQSRTGYLKMGWREVGRLPAAVAPRGPASLVTMLRARTPSNLWSEPIEVGDQWDAGSDRVEPEVAPRPDPADIRTLRTHRTAAYRAWRFGLDHLHYRVLRTDDVAIVVRVRRRGPAREAVMASVLAGTHHEADTLFRRSLKVLGADYGLRLGPPAPTRGFLPLPGGGPILTARPVTNHAIPPLPNWDLDMADVELF